MDFDGLIWVNADRPTAYAFYRAQEDPASACSYGYRN